MLSKALGVFEGPLVGSYDDMYVCMYTYIYMPTDIYTYIYTHTSSHTASKERPCFQEVAPVPPASSPDTARLHRVGARSVLARAPETSCCSTTSPKVHVDSI